MVEIMNNNRSKNNSNNTEDLLSDFFEPLQIVNATDLKWLV